MEFKYINSAVAGGGDTCPGDPRSLGGSSSSLPALKGGWAIKMERAAQTDCSQQPAQMGAGPASPLVPASAALGVAAAWSPHTMPCKLPPAVPRPGGGGPRPDTGPRHLSKPLALALAASKTSTPHAKLL